MAIVVLPHGAFDQVYLLRLKNGNVCDKNNQICQAPSTTPGAWRVPVYPPVCRDCLHPHILLGGSRGVDGHSWGDPYLKRRLRHVSEMPPYFSDFCLFLELCGYSANEPVSKLADGEKQQG